MTTPFPELSNEVADNLLLEDKVVRFEGVKVEEDSQYNRIMVNII